MKISVTDTSPVCGQRIELQIYAVTDDGPMNYIWSADGGTLEGTNNLQQYWAYWVAPETPGTYTITCILNDDTDEAEVIPFIINVSQRTSSSLLADGEKALSTTKLFDAKSGGIWAAINGKNLRYFCSTSTSNEGWGKNFDEIAVMTYRSYYYQTQKLFWGVSKDSTFISELQNSIERNINWDTRLDTDSVNVMKDDGSNIWIGADSGLHLYNTYSGKWTLIDYTEEASKQVHDISFRGDLVYLATETGVYTYSKKDGSKTNPYTGKTLSVITDADTPTDIWYLKAGTPNRLWFNDQDLEDIPAYVTTIDQDLTGRVWCGKYSYEDNILSEETGLDDATDHIIESIVSPEGLLYLRSEAGKLFVWGKKV